MSEKTSTIYNYYEQDIFWSEDFSRNPSEKIRIEEIMSSIPTDVKSILDVGCGNGAIVNKLVLQEKFNRIVGVDISRTALKYVTSEKYVAGISELPFEKNSFDLIICSEVLEHLPYRDLNIGISEIERLCPKYIIITVPNDQDIESELFQCPNCKCWFNHVYHFNSFNKDRLCPLFNNYAPLVLKEIGPVEYKNNYTNLTRLLFRYRKRLEPPFYSVCPQCGYQKTREKYISCKENIFKKILRKSKNIIIPRIKKSRWLLALYSKLD